MVYLNTYLEDATHTFVVYILHTLHVRHGRFSFTSFNSVILDVSLYIRVNLPTNYQIVR